MAASRWNGEVDIETGTRDTVAVGFEGNSLVAMIPLIQQTRAVEEQRDWRRMVVGAQRVGNQLAHIADAVDVDARRDTALTRILFAGRSVVSPTGSADVNGADEEGAWLVLQ